MKREKNVRAWASSGQKSRYIDRYAKMDKQLEQKAKLIERKKIDTEKAVEDLFKIVFE